LNRESKLKNKPKPTNPPLPSTCPLIEQLKSGNLPCNRCLPLPRDLRTTRLSGLTRFFQPSTPIQNSAFLPSASKTAQQIPANPQLPASSPTPNNNNNPQHNQSTYRSQTPSPGSVTHLAFALTQVPHALTKTGRCAFPTAPPPSASVLGVDI
jgi:hypothetical protein